jgi:hypothetical protein
MSEETRLVAEFVGAIFIAFISHYLTRSHYERKRQDDLADRDFNRRAAVHDMRIQEAREVVEKFSKIVSIASEFIRLVEQENDLESVIKLFPYGKDEIEKFPALMMDATNGKSSIELLKDKKLSGLIKKFFDLLRPSFEKIFSHYAVLENKFDEVRKDIKEISKRTRDGGITRDELSELEEMVSNLDMKSRIDVTDFRNELDIDELHTALGKARKVITEMNARLDVLASELR